MKCTDERARRSHARVRMGVRPGSAIRLRLPSWTREYGATYAMSTNVAKPLKVAIIGASGTYGKGILARAEEIGVEAVVVTRSPHKFKAVRPTTAVVETQPSRLSRRTATSRPLVT